MRSLKQQLLFLVIGPLLLLSISTTFIIGIHMKDRAELAAITKAKSDLATGEAIIDLMYPGPWEVRDGVLYKGGVKINNNFIPVDFIANLTGDTVTIFLGDTRVSTTVRNKNGERAIGTKVSDIVATTVLKYGQEYLGEANVVGEYYQTAYKPIRNQQGNIIGMLYVGISKKFSNQMIRNSLITLVIISGGLTLLVALGAWYFTQQVIIGPLQKITMGTREVASGYLGNKLEIKSQNEIGELAAAFNQMVEGLQRLALQISKATGNAGNGAEGNLPDENGKKQSPGFNTEKADVEDELPKGLNEVTLRQILAFLESKDIAMSAEEVGEGVNLTRVTARRYLEYLEKNGHVEVELKYGTVGRPVKLYKKIS
ncbi:cache domain-containing protein [Calderihabitans maritimus]|uniref:Putative sensor with HAMP domain-containing protein n=1 Tax=Calderihabitans maritimus TaxID=1246530 RepID=A0A1Z5HNJ6_9FIRM|nr:cache domain-containing protein [Calderihabitans maritimus]GAW91084.1 putative sensor with HAMP domain-containing protein [Calderihabitans maritimus]